MQKEKRYHIIVTRLTTVDSNRGCREDRFKTKLYFEHDAKRLHSGSNLQHPQTNGKYFYKNKLANKLVLHNCWVQTNMSVSGIRKAVLENKLSVLLNASYTS